MKILTAREKLQNSVRESDFLYVKKLEKRPKIRFTHTFDFHVAKKNTVPYYKNFKEKKSTIHINTHNFVTGLHFHCQEPPARKVWVLAAVELRKTLGIFEV